MRVLGLLFLLGFASFSSAQTFGFGGCPRVSVASDFDVDRYFGLWSLITTSFRSDSTCVTAEYQPLDDGSIRVINSGRSQNGDVTRDEGLAFQPNPDEGAKLQVLLYRGQTPQDYWVLDVDYDSYALVHSCTEYFFGWFNIQSNWLLARDRMPSEEIIEDALRKFREQGLNVQNFRRTNQMNCEGEPPLPSEDLAPTDHVRPRDLALNDRVHPRDLAPTDHVRPRDLAPTDHVRPWDLALNDRVHPKCQELTDHIPHRFQEPTDR